MEQKSELFNRSSLSAQSLLGKMNDDDLDQIEHDITYMESQEGVQFNKEEVSNFVASYYAAFYKARRDSKETEH